MLDRLKNPLRYPSDRSGALGAILRNLPRNTRKVVLPFYTGGGLEVSLANKGLRVSAYTDFQILDEFWHDLLRDPYRCSETGQPFHPIAAHE